MIHAVMVLIFIWFNTSPVMFRFGVVARSNRAADIGQAATADALLVARLD